MNLKTIRTLRSETDCQKQTFNTACPGEFQELSEADLDVVCGGAGGTSTDNTNTYNPNPFNDPLLDENGYGFYGGYPNGGYDPYNNNNNNGYNGYNGYSDPFGPGGPYGGY